MLQKTGEDGSLQRRAVDEKVLKGSGQDGDEKRTTLIREDVSVSVAFAAYPQYYLVKQSFTWLEAVSYCKSQYTDLVSTLTDMELLPVFAVAGWNDAWIGLYLCSPGVWRWSNGVTGTYTKWNSGEPNRTVNSCVRLSAGKWSDADCGARYYFVCYKLANTTVPPLASDCQWPLSPTTLQYVTTSSPELITYWNITDSQGVLQQSMGPGPGTSPGLGPGTSPGINSSSTVQPFTSGPTTAAALGLTTSGGTIGSTTLLGSTGPSGVTVVGILHLVQTPMTWAKSRTYCRTYYTDLASIVSTEEQTNIATLLSNYIPSKGFWFGLKRNRFWGHWLWSGGQAWGQYAYWGESEPSDPISKQCGLISGDPSKNFTWSSECCGEILPFMCYGG
ncbi:lymphocyte antigen 75-like isoform X2 [Phyllobates terribilis]|uniref:lymphocyte antigen 75-like isoform X2 n=1 Tax=Phyllobates terribilis TaxID=111132 RepID=UPI003CCB6BE7